jgi:hypothetical protein
MTFSLFFLSLLLFVPFVVLRFFFLLDDLLKLFFGFWLSNWASRGHEFKIQTLCFCVVNVLIKREIKKPSGQYLGLICDE